MIMILIKLTTDTQKLLTTVLITIPCP